MPAGAHPPASRHRQHRRAQRRHQPRRLFKALKAEGWLKFSTELAAGVAIPIVRLAVWRMTRRIHRRYFNHS